MTEQEFWEIIEATRKEAGDGTIAEWEDALRLQLDRKSAPQLIAFERHFAEASARAYHWDIWGAFYLILGGCGDDAFDAARTWLIFQGRKTFDAVVAGADHLAEVEIEDDFPPSAYESLAFVASQLYEQLTGEEEIPAAPIDLPEEPAGEEWDEDELEVLAARLPKVHARYGAA
jgi:hypothetical protein